jgi:hypothetical protein
MGVLVELLVQAAVAMSSRAFALWILLMTLMAIALVVGFVL